MSGNPTEDHSSRNPIMRAILSHYSRNTYHRSEKQIEREKYLLGLFPFNRWLLFPAAVLLQFCCGSLYAWSVFNKPIDNALYGDPNKGMAPITFYIAVGCFGLSAAIMGPWLERNGPMKASFIGSSLFIIGNCLTALAIHTKQLWLIYVGYGVIGGFGLGLTYISPVSALQKWFPDFRGMAAGFAVCGFGAGSIAFAQIPGPLIRDLGLPVTFTILAAIYLVVMFSCALIVRIPPPGYSIKGMTSDREKLTSTQPQDETVVEAKGSPSSLASDSKGNSSNRDVEAIASEGTMVPPGQASGNSHISSMDPSVIRLTLIESLTSREYLIMYFMFFANSIFGLVVISRLSNMVQDLFGRDASTAATIVSINGGLNLAGRLIFATISDRIGRKSIFCFFLTAQSIILIILPTLLNTRNYGGFLACMFILTACYGGGFGIIPAFLSDMFGSKNIGACHGVVLTAWAIAGVAGGLCFTGIYNNIRAGGALASDPRAYNVNLYWILALVLCGFIIVWFLRVSTHDRLVPPVEGEVFRYRVFGRLIRYVRGQGLRRVSRAQEQLEWEQFVSQARTSPQVQEKPLV
ncbi:MAG: oxalate/formate antiporter [Piptocephalis tieghemiana]|nr:MAG: oxalate/formate antiporter [Piptocephalis tieghemiana]